MSRRLSRSSQLKSALCGGLLLAGFPSGCAVAVEPGFDDLEGGGKGGTGPAGGSGPSIIPTQSGSSSGGGSPFGGTTASGGKAGSSSGGASTGGTAGSGGKGGLAGSGGTASGGTGGGGSGVPCACVKTVPWVDNTVLSTPVVTGNCVTTADAKKYEYQGVVTQTYANAQCRPAQQEVWCTDVGNDYKFTLCE